LRKEVSFQLTDVSVFKDALLCWSQQFDEVVWLDSNAYSGSYSSFEGLMATDALTSKITDIQNAFADLREYQEETKDWIFGYIKHISTT